MYPELIRRPALPDNAGIMIRQQWERSVLEENIDHHHHLHLQDYDHKLDFGNIVKPDPGMEECYWAGFDHAGGLYGDDDQFGGYGFVNQNGSFISSVSVSPKKRKADDDHDKGETLKVVLEKEKKMKRCSEEDSKIVARNNNNNNNNSNNNNTKRDDSSKHKSKVSEVQKTDYIHVRARRGQATDSHSLAERVRREKISERMKYLQDLVPGCNKITVKAGMLDEIINYVQSLQKQVEFLSLKLATVNPELDFNIVNGLTKEMIQAQSTELSAFACSSTNYTYFEQLSSPDQAVSYCGLDIGLINSEEMGLRNGIPLTIPNNTFMDSSCCYNVISSDISSSLSLI